MNLRVEHGEVKTLTLEEIQNSECSWAESAPRQRHTSSPTLERGSAAWFGLGLGGAICSVNLYVLVFADEPI